MARSIRPLLLFVLGLILAGTVSAELLSRDVIAYTRDVAEIQEIHKLELDKGEHGVRIGPVPSGVMVGSASLDASGLEVATRALSFTGETMDMDRYWQSRVGDKIRVETDDGDVQGTLRMVTSDALYFQTGRNPDTLQKVKRNDIEDDELSGIGDELATAPSFHWAYRADKGGEATVRLTYLTEGIHWSGQHRIALEGRRAAVVAAAQVVNETGMTLDYDNLHFIGGAIHLAGDRRRVDRVNPRPGAVASGPDANRFGDMRRWSTGPGTLLTDHSTRLELFGEPVDEVERTYVYDATIFDDRVSAHLEFTTDAALPGGDVRVYEVRQDDALFIGSDRVDDTPPGSPVDLTVGQVFDLTAERMRMNEGRGPEANTTSQTFQVQLGNSGSDPVTIKVLERLFGEWSIQSASVNGSPADHEKVDARTAAFHVPVPAGETRTLTYEIRYAR